MEYHVSYTEHGLPTVVYSGLLTSTELEDSTRAVLAEIETRGCDRVLIDLRAAEVGLRTMDIYDFARRTSGPEFARLKRALVVSHDHCNYTFYENVSRNLGLRVRVFDSIAKAERWLAQGASAVLDPNTA